eukprot:CAMPEP_0195124352 /NCGR_PEP_ID=MMETSP0448-20130528/130593_1 /TAXON_ID=66468 /ORGANISM="Heterocapsa triquestra, Strain CCMP 448" /LENGTH=707 /DNA_ID=CAMNT_0040161941 /DNA_START=62 /DNA_END=2185 /DNA_ORIENTATION=+
MSAVAAALLVVFAAAAGSVGASRVTPVQKVLELLHGMLSKATAAKKEEAVQWTAYKQWCSDSEANKQERVKAADIKLESLQADIQMFDAEALRLDGEIEDHEADIVAYNASLHNATAQRQLERKEYVALHQDYSESVTAVEKAIDMLKKQAYNRPQAAELLQRLAASAPAVGRRAIKAFLEEAGDGLALVAAPGEAHGYEFQSGGILELLQELSDKFVSKRTELEKEEMEKSHRYEMLAQDYQASTAAAKHEIGKKSEAAAKNRQASADAAKQLKDLSATRADDAEFLDGLHATCNQKASDFTSREELRQSEIDNLSKAIEMLSADAVKGAAEKHLPALAAKGSSVSKAKALVQTHSLRKNPSQEAAAVFLQGASQRVGSSILLSLAMRVRDDPFGKVKKIIEDLIARLQEEAQAEADHKRWCDDELGTNEQTRTSKTSEVENLHFTIDELDSRIAVLDRTIADLSKAIAELTDSMAKAEKLRQDEKAENQDTIAEAVGAQMSVQQAITLLQDFYASAAQATVLAQGRARSRARARQAPTPPIFDKAYGGRQTESDNVIAFLQVIQSDFARLESDTTGAEEAAQSAHDKFMTDAGADREQKETDTGIASTEHRQKKLDLATAKSDLDLAQSELDAALEYYDKLKPSCVSATTENSWEERIKRREEEIQALKEALSILSGETLVAGPDSLYSSVNGGNVGLDVGITAN